MEPEDRRQLHIFEAGWKSSGGCGSPGCTLPDFHEGLCSTERVVGRRKRPAPESNRITPAGRATRGEGGGGPKKRAIVYDDDSSNDDDESPLSLRDTVPAGTWSPPDPESFSEGEEQRLRAQLAAVQKRLELASQSAGPGRDMPAPAPPPPAPAPASAPSVAVPPYLPPPPLAQRQKSLPGPRSWSAWASLELRSLLVEWNLAEQAADIVEHSGARSVLELEVCADLGLEVCPPHPPRPPRSVRAPHPLRCTPPHALPASSHAPPGGALRPSQAGAEGQAQQAARRAEAEPRCG